MALMIKIDVKVYKIFLISHLYQNLQKWLKNIDVILANVIFYDKCINKSLILGTNI